MVDDLALPVVGVEALAQREHVERVALETTKLCVQVCSRQILGGLAELSRVFIIPWEHLIFEIFMPRRLVGQLEKLRVLAEGETPTIRPALLAGLIEEFADAQIQNQPFHRILVHEVHRDLQKVAQIVGDLLFVDAEFLVETRKIKVITLGTLGLPNDSALLVHFIGVPRKLRKYRAIPDHVNLLLFRHDKESAQNTRVKDGFLVALAEHALNGANHLMPELPQVGVPLDLDSLELLRRTHIPEKQRSLLTRVLLGRVTILTRFRLAFQVVVGLRLRQAV